MGALDVLVSAEAFEQHGHRLDAAHGAAVRWWTIDADGTVGAVRRDDTGQLPSGGPEIAWLSNDVFYSGVFAELVERLPGYTALRWVQSAAAGTDAAVFQRLMVAGVRLTTSHVTALSVAEYVLGAVLRHYQQPGLWERAAARREWRHHDFREVAGTTWLIVGLGAIGREVAQRARAFGARVVGVRRHPDGSEPVDEVILPSALAPRAAEADVVVLCAPANPATRHMVDADLLARLPPTAVLVNVARGSLVDEEALVAALDGGHLEHAILDVTATEPPPAESPLWDHSRITLTPHSSGAGTGRYHRAAEVFSANLARYRRGEPLVDEVTDLDTPGPGWRGEDGASA